MSSPYFMQSGSVITRSAGGTAGSNPVGSLRSKLTRKRRDGDEVPSAGVKVEVEEATISEQGPSSVPPTTTGRLR